MLGVAAYQSHMKFRGSKMLLHDPVAILPIIINNIFCDLNLPRKNDTTFSVAAKQRLLKRYLLHKIINEYPRTDSCPARTVRFAFS